MQTFLSFTNGVIECLCLYSEIQSLLLIVVYRQPDDAIHGHPSNTTHFNELLRSLTETMRPVDSPLPDIVFGGDFNLPNIDWLEKTSSTCTKEVRNMAAVMESFTTEFFLEQYVTQPTHKDGNTLDLVFINNDDLILDIQVIPCLQMVTHHSIVEVTTSIDNKMRVKLFIPAQPSGFRALNFHDPKIDWKTLKEKLASYNWNADFRNKTTEQMLTQLLDVTLAFAREYVPLRKMQKKVLSRTARKRLNLCRRRKRINQLMKKIQSPSKYKKLRNEHIEVEMELMEIYRQISCDREKDAVKAKKTNPKFFYNYINKFSKSKTPVGPLRNDKGELVQEPERIADLLSIQYSSVYTVPSEKPASSNTEVPVTIEDIKFDIADIAQAIDDLKPTAAAGFDGFPAQLLKKCRDALSIPLFILWRNCLDKQEVPSALKHAMITPIYKGKSKLDAENYRPVALTSHIIKIFERVVQKNLVHHFEEANAFNDSQHGFRRGRSCLSQLLAHHNEVLENLENSCNADVIYLDFAKAFDKVDFNVLLQ